MGCHWYGGHYPLAPYSVLYYFPAVLVGNVPLVASAGVASALLFASVADHQWGAAARWPTRIFALLSAAPLLAGNYPFALGLAAGLAAVGALQIRRTGLTIGFAVLTLGFSPLAFAFLGLVLVALAAARPRVERRVVETAIGVGIVAACGAALAFAFPGPANIAFPAASLAPLLAVCALGAALAARSPDARPVAALFAAWAVASVAVFALATPLGATLTRVRPLVLPLVLLAAVLAQWRPRWLAFAAVAAAVAYTVIPYGARIVDATHARSYQAAAWAPALAFLEQDGPSAHRVEVVPTAAHWEAYYLPRAGVALARGWYRQLDAAENALLYEDTVSASAYEEWLRRRAVRYVVLPPFPLDAWAAGAEADLLRSGRSGLTRVFADAGWTIYELPKATPLLTGPGRSAVTDLTHARVEGFTSADGTFRLRIRYTPQLGVAVGSACVSPAADGMTTLEIRRPGRFVLEVTTRPVEVLVAAAGGESRRCRTAVD